MPNLSKYFDLVASPAADSKYRSPLRDELVSASSPSSLKHPIQNVRSVSHDPVHPISEQATHVRLGIDGPHVHPHAQLVRRPNEARGYQAEYSAVSLRY